MVIQGDLFSDLQGGELYGLVDPEELVGTTLAAALKPDPRDTVDEWADKHRYLDTSTSAEPGLYKTARAPYTKEIMRALSPDDPCREVVVMKGAQLGLTEVGNNWVGCTIHRYPSPIIMVLPTVPLAKRTSRTRIDTMVRDSPELRARVKEKRSKEGGNTATEKEFPGGLLVLTGANSAAGMRSTPASKLFLDEIDAYPPDVEGEGDPVKLAERATRTFTRKKIFKISTPTFAKRSKIATAFEKSDKSYFHVPCPRCGEFQRLLWSQIKFEKEYLGSDPRIIEKSVHYECVHCEEAFYEWEKQSFLSQGVWVASVPELSHKSRGFHVSALYSPLGWRSWTDIAQDFVSASGNPDLLRVWTNHDLGECWDESGSPPDWELLYNRRETFKLGEVPDRACLITAGVDVQADRIEFSVHAWAPNFESWVIDRGLIVGDVEKGEGFAELEEVLARQYPHTGSGVMMPIRKAGIDSGFATQSIYGWARSQSKKRVALVKGRDQAATLISIPTSVEIKVNGRRFKAGLQLYSVGVSLAKSEIYGWLRAPQPTKPEESGYPRGYVHFPQLDEEYFLQLTAEQLVPSVRRGPGGHEIGKRYTWEKTRPRNEMLDTFVYARAAHALVGADRWSAERWDDELLEVGSAPASPQSPSSKGSNPETPTDSRPRARSRFSRWRT